MGKAAQLRIDLLERALGGLDRMARRRRSEPEMLTHLATGLAGEDAAFFDLRRKGYTIVARRWCSGDVPGDIYLIAWQGSLLCFVEVKTRTAHDMTPAESAVDSHKRAVFTPPRAPLCAATSAGGDAAGPVRCDQRLSGAGREAGVHPL